LNQLNPVLYIDDAASNLFLVELIAQDQDIPFETASSGTEGIDKIDAKNFSMILSDIRLPDVSGYEILKQTRAGEPNKFTPVIAFTADVTNATREKIVAHGFTDYLTKPFRDQELIKRFNIYRTTVDIVPDFENYTTFIKDEGQLTKAKKMVLIDFQDFEMKFSQAWMHKDEKQLKEQLHKILFVCQNLKLTSLVNSITELRTNAGYDSVREVAMMRLRRDLLSLYKHLG
jgi:CheY-like chemotaxis protein